MNHEKSNGNKIISFSLAVRRVSTRPSILSRRKKVHKLARKASPFGNAA
jgi:hypothetical protein